MSNDNKQPIVNLAQQDPEQTAALAKLVSNHTRAPARDVDGSRKVTVPNASVYRNRLNKRAKSP